MSLSVTQIKALKPSDKPYRVSDEKGLYLIVRPDGALWWRFDFTIHGIRKTLSFGVFPDTGLKNAREKRDAARRNVAAGIDPSALRQSEKEAKKDTFKALACEWHTNHRARWSESHASDIMARMEKNLFPWLGDRPLTELGAPEILTTLRRIENRGAPVPAQRALQYISQVFRFAVQTGRAERDPTTDLRGALKTTKQKNRASIIDGVFDNAERGRRIGSLLRALDTYEGGYVVQCALRISPHLVARPGEIRNAKWSEIDLDNKEWRFLVTKTNVQHIVPLSRQSLSILCELKSLTGDSEYVFPSPRSKTRPMSDNATLSALRRMAISKEEMTNHGWRAIFRTMADEVLACRPEHLEIQLAHSVRDANGTAYNRTSFIEQRHELMQKWSDYLDSLR